MIGFEDFEQLHMEDPHYRNVAAMIASDLLHVASLPGFIDEIDGNTPEKLGNNPRVERPDGKKAAEDLRRIVDGIYNSVVIMGSEQLDMETMYEKAQLLDLLAAFLNKKAPSGITYLQAMKNAAEKDYQAKKKAVLDAEAAFAEQNPGQTYRRDAINGITSDQLMDDLYYLDDKLELEMDLPQIDPASAPKKKKLKGEPSWENYMKDHLKDIPHTLKGKEEFLAKAMVGAFFKGREGKEGAEPFSVKGARKYSATLQKNPVFKRMCENPVTLKKMLDRAQENPFRLYTTAMQVYRPFYGIGQEQRMEVLRKLKTMEPLMDRPEGRSSSYRAMVESIQSIDLNDPAKCGEAKLMEILEKNLAYLKGKKAYRNSEDKIRRFDQGMDILFTLGTAGPAARMQAETVLDRVNEVRMKHDPRTVVKAVDYGPTQLPKHSLEPAETMNAVRKQLFNSPEEPKEDRFVFEKYPKNDQSLMPAWKQTNTDAPLRVHTEIDKAKNFLQHGGTGRRLTLPEAMVNLARLLALSECKMYHLSKERIPEYFANNKIDGKKIDGSIAVISERAFTEKYTAYLADPALERLAQNYTAPRSRQDLASKEIKTIKAGERIRKKVRSEDPHDIDIKRLKNEYNDIKKEMNKDPQIGI